MIAQRIAIYGKGGVGKSTIATNLSLVYAKAGHKVLHVGCDPKGDSSLRLLDGAVIPSVLEALRVQGDRVTAEDFVAVGRHGVEVVESGGPEPGVGCAGRGVSVTIERLEALRLVERRGYEVVVYDVLGDVVCGGFAAPLRKGVGQQVCIVTSEEPLSLFAANNIARAIVRFSRNGVVLGGIVANLRERGASAAPIEAFAVRLGTRLLAVIERDPLVTRAEAAFKTVVEHAPDSPVSAAFVGLADLLRADREGVSRPPPTPLNQPEFVAFVREHLSAPEDRDGRPRRNADTR